MCDVISSKCLLELIQCGSGETIISLSKLVQVKISVIWKWLSVRIAIVSIGIRKLQIGEYIEEGVT